jgi:hypothetical protein
MRGERPGNTIQAIAFPPLELALISSARGAYFGALDDALKPLLNKDADKAKPWRGGSSWAFRRKLPTETVLRDWSLAERWLQREITNAL